MKSSQGDKQRLLHINDALLKIEAFTKDMDEAGFMNNELVQSAVERQLEIIGEATANISSDLREKYPDVPWYKIKAFRNIIAHEYFGISLTQVWNVVKNDLPQLKASISNIIPEVN